MARGISLHVGINGTQAPGINVPPLRGCENDAEAMRLLARSRNFVALHDDDDVPLVGDRAIFENVLGKIRLAAEELVAGDIFLFTFSGHGTRRGADDTEEVDLKDETLVLFDKLLIDNVLRRHLWPKFRPGVRVVMVSDSCHSGTVSMSMVDRSEDSDGPSDRVAANDFRIRSVSEGQAQTHFDLLADFYDELRNNLPSGPAPPIEASLLLLAACQDHETTRDGLPNGVFTQALLDVWDTEGSKTYQQLIDEVAAKLQPTGRHPAMLIAGASPAFADSEAFTI